MGVSIRSLPDSVTGWQERDSFGFDRYMQYFAYSGGKPRPSMLYVWKKERLCLKLHGREKLSADFHKMEHFFRVKLTNGYASLPNTILLFEGYKNEAAVATHRESVHFQGLVIGQIVPLLEAREVIVATPLALV